MSEIHPADAIRRPAAGRGWRRKGLLDEADRDCEVRPAKGLRDEVSEGTSG